MSFPLVERLAQIHLSMSFPLVERLALRLTSDGRQALQLEQEEALLNFRCQLLQVANMFFFYQKKSKNNWTNGFKHSFESWLFWLISIKLLKLFLEMFLNNCHYFEQNVLKLLPVKLLDGRGSFFFYAGVSATSCYYYISRKTYGGNMFFRKHVCGVGEFQSL